MTEHLDLADWTWEELSRLDGGQTVIIIPVGATEAHGPHLPLATDVIISQAMARSGAMALRRAGRLALVAPPVSYTVAAFASGFSGTISVRPETAVAVLEDVGASLISHGFKTLALANAHLDPTHIGSLYEAQKRLVAQGALVAFPDITRKPWALRLSDEFKSGACHAGQYEGSIVLAERGDLVRREIAETLPANPASLSVAIRDGKTSFQDAGGPRAYFGDPAAATAEEGRETIRLLGAMIEESVLAL